MNVELDPKLVWRLSDIAEAQGTDLSGAVASLLAGGVGSPEVVYMSADGERTRAEVERLVRAGWPDTDIAVEIGRVKEHVARVRRGLGLKSNRRRRVVS